MANGPGYPPTPASGADDLERAMLALRGDRPNDAERMAGAVLKSDPHNVRALHIFGCALLMQGRALDAVASLQAAARSRHDPEIETELAIALLRTGRNDDALARLKRTTKRKPPYAPAFRELGYLLGAMERYDEAVEALHRGLEIAPMMPELSIELGYVWLRRRSFSDAKVAFGRALGISPHLPGALFGMAKAHQELGENQAAAECFRHCLLGRPNDTQSWTNLGHCLLELGQLDAGYECFRTAARGDAKLYGDALTSLAASGHGRFWLKPSAAARYFRVTAS